MKLEKKHPLAIRWFHWINFPVLCVMIWSGLLIYWANDVYRVGFGEVTLFHFFPRDFYQTFNLKYRLAEGIAWHFLFMWFFIVNGVLYVGYTALSGEWRYLLPNRDTFREAFAVVLHDLHLSKEPLPRRKFNGAQRLAYTGILVMGAGSLLTGLAMYKPVQFASLTALLGGYAMARWEHFLLTIGYVVFFVLHVVQVIRAGWNNFRSMITGYELVPVPEEEGHDDAERKMGHMSRRGFAVAGAAALLGLGGWQWLRTRNVALGIPWPFRRMLEVNERLSQAYFKDTRLAPTFPLDRAREPKVNGRIGLDPDFEPANWVLRVETPSRKAVLEVSLEQIKAMSPVDMVTELKCIEGWSQVVHWTGVRFADFIRAYRLGTHSVADPGGNRGDLFPYVQLETPDGDYYVGLDMASALHPQTLLCYAMNGQPLTAHHGAPLRLVMTVKYGLKSIKRIGRICFMDERSADFWAERGYDWYSGH